MARARVTRLTYRDAVKILGARNSPLVATLDKVFGGLLLGASAGAGRGDPAGPGSQEHSEFGIP
jgi:hypothetical protein